MYTLTRKKAAKLLGVSTRSVDRYIKSGKLRSKKEGKIVYVNNKDVANMNSEGDSKQEIIVNTPYTKKEEENKREESTKVKDKVQEKKVEEAEIEVTSKFTRKVLDSVYTDLREQIKEKDEIIRELSIRLGRAEEIAKNSVSLNDFKRSQFLLEESREHLNKEIEDVTREKDTLKKRLRYEKSSNIMLIVACIVLFVVAAFVFVTNI